MELAADPVFSRSSFEPLEVYLKHNGRCPQLEFLATNNCLRLFDDQQTLDHNFRHCPIFGGISCLLSAQQEPVADYLNLALNVWTAVDKRSFVPSILPIPIGAKPVE